MRARQLLTACLLVLAPACGSPHCSQLRAAEETTEEAPPPQASSPIELPEVPAHCGETLEFEDPALEALVRAEIDQPKGPILATDVARLTEVDSENLPDEDVTLKSLKGIECLGALKKLVLNTGYPGYETCEVEDLRPVSTLATLEELVLNDCQVSDLSPLSGLVQLQGLGLYGNQVKSLGDLSSLRSLRSLSLQQNAVEDLRPLSSLLELRHLDLWNAPRSGWYISQVKASE